MSIHEVEHIVVEARIESFWIVPELQEKGMEVFWRNNSDEWGINQYVL